MAVLASTSLGYAEWAKRLDPDGSLAVVVDLLSKTNPIVQDAQVVEGNLPTGHRTTVLSGLPTVTWRKLYGGVQPSKATTSQVTDSVGMLEAYSHVDKALLELNGMSATFRLSEERTFLESMNQEMATKLFYGNAALNPEQFTGLAPRYSSLGAENGKNIIDGGGTSTDNTSMWFVQWGDQSLHMIFPKGQKAGLTQEDLGQVTAIAADTGLYEALRTHWVWKVGLVLRDWRQNVRIANIDVSDIITAGAAGSTAAALNLKMIDAYFAIQNMGMGQGVIYCNRTIAASLTKLQQAKTNLNLTLGEWAGAPCVMFYGWPIRACDAILNTEARVV